MVHSITPDPEGGTPRIEPKIPAGKLSIDPHTQARFPVNVRDVEAIEHQRRQTREEIRELGTQDLAALQEAVIDEMEAAAEGAETLIGEAEEGKREEEAAQVGQFFQKKEALAKKNAALVIESLVTQSEHLKAEGDYLNNLLTAIGTPFQLVETYAGKFPERVGSVISESMGKPISQMKGGKVLEQSVTQPIGKMILLYKVDTTLVNLGLLLYQEALLHQIKKQLRTDPRIQSFMEDPVIKQKLEQFETQLAGQQVALRQQWKTLGISTLKYFPVGFKRVWEIASTFSPFAAKVLPIVKAASVFGMEGTTLIIESIRLAQAVKNVKKHSKWTTKHEGDAQFQGPEDVKALLEKRKKIEERRSAVFRTRLNEVLEKYQTFEQVETALREVGVTIPSVMKGGADSLEVFKGCIKADIGISQLALQYARYKDSMALTTRNALKTLVKKKQGMIAKALRFRRNTQASVFSTLVVGALAIIAVEVLILTGVIVGGGLLMSGLGLGFFLLGFVGGIIGFIYFAKKNPNLFREFIRGVQLRLFFYSIPTAVRQFQLQKAKYDLIEQQIALNTVSAQIVTIEGLLLKEKVEEDDAAELKKLKLKAGKALTPALRETLVAYRKELEARLASDSKQMMRDAAIRKRVARLEEKAKSWEERAAPLQERTVNAAYQDFLLHFRKKEGGEIDIASRLAEGLLEETEVFDSGIESVLNEQFNIDWETLRAMPDRKAAKEKIETMLKKLFGMTESQTIQLIESQKERVKWMERRIREQEEQRA